MTILPYREDRTIMLYSFYIIIILTASEGSSSDLNIPSTVESKVTNRGATDYQKLGMKIKL